jgi:hypothetical protein
LKPFGIDVDATKANKAYADSLDIVGRKLTQEEERLAFATEAVRQMKDVLARAGEPTLSLADKADILAAAITDIKTAIGEGIVLSIETNVDTDSTLTKLQQIGAALHTLNTLKQNTQTIIRQLPVDQQAAAMERYTHIVKGLEGLNVDDVLRTFNDELRAEIGLLPQASIQAMGLAFSIGQIVKAANGVRFDQFSPPSTTMANGMSPSQYSLTPGQSETIVANEIERQSTAKQQLNEWQGRYNDRLAEAQRLESQIRSDAEAVLMAGTSVTQGDVLATQAGNYKDKPLEAARRLEDIANRGMDSPWAKILVPPAEVIAQGDAAIKAWAAGTKQDVLDLTRPDLINWDAFVSGFDQMKQREAGKQLTLDIAIGKLDEAGLLTGVSQEDRKKQVAKALGIDTGMFGGLNLGAVLVGTLNSDFKANEAGFKTVGKNAGVVTSGAFLEAMKGNVGNLLDTFAQMVAPQVADILSKNLAGTGSAH